MSNLPLELLKKDIISKYVDHEYLDNIIIFNELPSTNTYLLEQAKTNDNKILICLAEHQTAGKGRLDRKWLSPFAQNIYLSILWSFTKNFHELSGLSLATAIAVTETLKQYGIKNDITLKWPNDVLWQQRKIAGILIELIKKSNQTCNAVIGVGLNVNMQYADIKQIEQPWCSIAQIIDAVPQRNKVAGLLLNNLIKTMIIYQQKGLKPFLAKWQKLDITYNKKVTIITNKSQVTGISLGINEQGYFLLKTSNNKILSFVVGEVSLKI